VVIEASKTHRLYLLLKERISSGAFVPGQQLPSEPTLALMHNLSRVTIRRALDGLAREGLISRQPGAGTFVRSPSSTPPIVADLTNMLANLVAMGRATRVRILGFSYGKAPVHVAKALHLKPDERTQHSLRVRYLDDVPFSYLSTHVPERIGLTYSEDDLAQTPLLVLLEHSGVVVSSAGQTISATLAGPEAASALDVEIGAPLLCLTRVVIGQDGHGVEHLTALYRPDMHSFHMDLIRTGDSTNRIWHPKQGLPTSSNSRLRAATTRRRP
jgi:GntR family transcriptional regulator